MRAQGGVPCHCMVSEEDVSIYAVVMPSWSLSQALVQRSFKGMSPTAFKACCWSLAGKRSSFARLSLICSTCFENQPQEPPWQLQAALFRIDLQRHPLSAAYLKQSHGTALPEGIHLHLATHRLRTTSGPPDFPRMRLDGGRFAWPPTTCTPLHLCFPLKALRPSAQTPPPDAAARS